MLALVLAPTTLALAPQIASSSLRSRKQRRGQRQKFAQIARVFSLLWIGSCNAAHNAIETTTCPSLAAAAAGAATTTTALSPSPFLTVGLSCKTVWHNALWPDETTRHKHEPAPYLASCATHRHCVCAPDCIGMMVMFCGLNFVFGPKQHSLRRRRERESKVHS